MTGSVANFRLFNRALTSDEIYQLYAYQKEDFGHGDLSMTLKAGRLGIGNSEPRAALDVRGGVMVEAPLTIDTSVYGEVLRITKGGTIAGSIDSFQANEFGITSDNNLVLQQKTSTDRNLVFSTSYFSPFGSDDNTIDLGRSNARFDDVYATNGSIQTSDHNEKQDIAELSDAERRVAVACKGLLRKFRWKHAVAEKGDEARTHFGIIAQDLRAVFEAEGLDAGNYGMFIHSTWKDEETDEEKTRMGIRYNELLAFIISVIG